jgi:hypothetical protein
MSNLQTSRRQKSKRLPPCEGSPVLAMFVRLYLLTHRKVKRPRLDSESTALPDPAFSGSFRRKRAPRERLHIETSPPWASAMLRQI